MTLKSSFVDALIASSVDVTVVVTVTVTISGADMTWGGLTEGKIPVSERTMIRHARSSA